MTNQHKVPRVVWQGWHGGTTYRIVVTERHSIAIEFVEKDSVGVSGWARASSVLRDGIVTTALCSLPEFTPPPSKETP